MHHALPIIKVSCDNSPWSGYTGSAEEEQAGFRVAAIDRMRDLQQLPHLSQDIWRGEPILAIDAERRRVVVNAAVFSELERPDATRLAPGEQALVGVLRNQDAFAGYGDLFHFLLRAELVRSYRHIGATIGLAELIESEQSCRARFCAMHEYWTDACHRSRYSFSICIDKTSREIKVIGESLQLPTLSDQDIFISQGSTSFGTLWAAMRSQDMDTTDIRQLWWLLDSPQFGAGTLLLRQHLADWARSPNGLALALWQPVTDELCCGICPRALGVTADRLAAGQLYVGDSEGRRLLKNDEAAKLFRDALHWCSEPYDDLLPEFAEHVCRHLGTPV